MHSDTSVLMIFVYELSDKLNKIIIIYTWEEYHSKKYSLLSTKAIKVFYTSAIVRCLLNILLDIVEILELLNNNLSFR